MTKNLLSRSPDYLKIVKDSSKALRQIKKVDPTNRYVLLYPDSDNAYVGMGFKLLNTPAEDIYSRASKLLQKDLFKLCLQGPRSDLIESFENQQLAAFVTSHATMTKFLHENPVATEYCKGAGGIGVGFVNSLVFCGSMSFQDGLDLVMRRAQAMEKAAQIIPNAKLRLRLKPATAKWKICQAAVEECIKKGIPRELAVCSISKSIYPQVVEVCGHEVAMRYLESEGNHLFEFREIRRVKRNPHAFNSDLMKPASDFVCGYIKQRLNSDPGYIKEPQSCSVYSATSGRRLRCTEQIIEDLYTYPTSGLKVEQLLNLLFARPQKIAQPNILVMWDRNLMRNLSLINRKAGTSAKLLQA